MDFIGPEIRLHSIFAVVLMTLNFAHCGLCGLITVHDAITSDESDMCHGR